MKLNFIHLTIPSQGTKSDKFIKLILNRFILYAYRKTGLRSYVWKAEPQARGEIHFHITNIGISIDCGKSTEIKQSCPIRL